MAKIGIVIVNYNGEKVQNECIKSLREMSFSDFEIIVVDSGSSDNSIEMLKKTYPDVYLIECKENVGVAAGNNIGIKKSIELGTEYTLLINNDTEVDKELLNIMVDSSINNKVVVPKIYYYDNKEKLWFAGGKLDWKKGRSVHFGIGEVDRGQYDEKRIINYAPTCCMLIPNDVFNLVGLMDEKYFMYFDDTDFCARLEEKKIDLLYEPQAVMWHKVSSSTGGENSKVSIYYCYRNQLYYLNKFKNNISFLTICYVYVTSFFRGTILSLRPHRHNDRFIFLGQKDYRKGRMGRKDF